MSKTSGTIDLKSLKSASTEATNYVTDIDNNGISVHPKGGDSNKITISSAIEIFKNAISYLKIWVDGTIAKIRIGKEDSSHFLIQDGKISGYGNASNIYFETGDSGERVKQTYIGDGSNKYFNVMSATSLIGVKVNGSTVSATLRNSSLVELTSIPADGAKIVIEYNTSLNSSPYFTFGTRKTNEDETIGVGSSSFGNLNVSSGFYSTAEGESCIANGYASHAEGKGSQAYGSRSHAEGTDCVTWGQSSHAEGNECTAYSLYSHAGGNASETHGLYSFAHGLGVKTTQDSEEQYGAMACGKYNFPYSILFGVGYGESNNNRKNAFSVGASGNCFIDGILKSGTPSLNSGDNRNMFHIEDKTFSNLSIPANDRMSSAQTKSIAVTGYTPIAISNFAMSGTNGYKCFPYSMTFSGNNLIFNIYNTSSSAVTATIRFTILYMATKALGNT